MLIKYYLIHCDEHVERDTYVRKLKEDFNQEITIFKGIYTKNVGFKDQQNYIKEFNPKITAIHKFCLPGEIGCYLSHFSLIEHIMKHNESDYSVIFEDDVVFDTTTLHSDIEKIIQYNVDFDILFLGNNSNNKGEPIIDNIYHVNKQHHCWGTHALLIHNKHIEKIFNVNCTIRHTIDVHYTIANRCNRLNCVVIQPVLCGHNEFKSNIQDSEVLKTYKLN